MGGLHGSAEKEQGAVSVTRGAESATRRIMWSVFFVFLSYLDRNLVKGDFLSRPLDAEKESKEAFSLLNGTFCAKTSTDRESLLYQVSDGAEVVSSVVSAAGELLDCSVIPSPMEVKSFMHECRLRVKEQRDGHQLGARFTRVDEAKLACREFREKSRRGGRIQRQDESELQEKVLKRSKRGFTYPGTLWCGAGNMADHYDQLGTFALFRNFLVTRVSVGVLTLPTVLQENLQRPTAAAASTTTARTSSMPSPPTMATPTSSGIPSATVTAMKGENESSTKSEIYVTKMSAFYY